MITERIYRNDQYRAANDAVITDVRVKNGCDMIACSASVFFPEGGGQPSDVGTVSCSAGCFNITHVSDDGLWGNVWHLTAAPAGTFEAGMEVTLTIDRDKRLKNMQRHCGEHMLSGTMDRLFGGVNRGFHMGDEYVTIDIDLGGRMLTDDELDLAERTVNKAIWADLPVTVTWFDDYEASLSMPVRKAVPHDGRVSVVTVGDLKDPYDCIACCGTHPARSSEVGLLAIYKCEPNKGMNRIYFDCGSSAFKRLKEDHHMLSDIAKKRSCSTADLPGRLDTEAAAASDLRAQLSALSAYVKEAEKERILADIYSIRAGSRSDGAADAAVAAGADAAAALFYCCDSEILSIDETLKLGFAVINECPGLLLLMKHKDSGTCLLLSSGEAKCGALVKEHAKKFGGKGGGRDDNARALFSSEKDMDQFAEELYALYAHRDPRA